MSASGDPEPQPAPEGRREWHVTPEFRQRLGCGLITAVGLPIWFGVMALALGRDVSVLAFGVAILLFCIAAAVGIPAFRRIRRLPTAISLDDGWVQLSGRNGGMALPVDAITSIEIASGSGLESVRLHTRQGRVVRLPGDLDDLDGLVAALRAANPRMSVTDHRGEEAA